MFIKTGILATLTKNPRLFGIALGLAITLAVGTAIGMVDGSSHIALADNHIIIPTKR